MRSVLFETHATSVDNEAGLASGWYDADLSPLGVEQARELGARRAGEAIAAVCTSDLVRAVRTAEIAFAPRGVPILRDARLRECDYGRLTREPAAALEAQRPAYVGTPFPGGESYEDVARRVAAWLDDARRAFPGGAVIVVGHRATLYALQHLLDGVPLRDAVSAPWRWQPGWRFEMPGTGAR